ncbi:MAG TPA: glycerol-3-phosphate 1-O-acyltransferase PlsY [Chthonomonadales bacterium]|nr:glycerol-3-phosphate 1-O-acyltransferase PlsY [Chthonomonadales bacterium]
MSAIHVGLLIFGSYLLGSLPFGFLIARWWSGVDIRTIGSGNIGSTNVGRACGPVAAVIVLLLDFGKGWIPCTVARVWGMSAGWQVAAALLAIIGHNYSIWLRMKGGKGIATGAGALTALAPVAALAALILFLLELLVLGYVSLGSLIATTSVPLLTAVIYRGDPYRLAFGVAGWLLVVYKHRSNIERLRTGVEPRVQLPWRRDRSISNRQS